MRSSRPSLRRTMLLSAVVTLSLFSAAALAQGNNNQPSSNAPAPTSSGNAPSSAASSGAASSSNRPASSSSAAQSTAAQSSTTPPPRVSSMTAGAPPSLSGGMPKATNTRAEIPDYPAASVPPTYHAPFMRHSTLPQGTVFICVGAILGAFGVAVLVWRGIIACLLHRSVERAAQAQHTANDKASFPPPPAPFYKSTERDSSPHLVGTVGRGQRRTNRGPIPSSTPSQTNLFFSPTAGNANNSSTMLGTAASRDSRFLPSGFYAAGTSSPGAGHGRDISMTNLRPDSRGYTRTMATTPPESPALGPRTPGTMPRAGNMSTSSINLAAQLNRPPSSRAPSAYLDDLLDDQPHLFPPGGPPSAHQNRNSSASQLGRY